MNGGQRTWTTSTTRRASEADEASLRERVNRLTDGLNKCDMIVKINHKVLGGDHTLPPERDETVKRRGVGQYEKMGKTMASMEGGSGAIEKKKKK